MDRIIFSDDFETGDFSVSIEPRLCSHGQIPVGFRIYALDTKFQSSHDFAVMDRAGKFRPLLIATK